MNRGYELILSYREFAFLELGLLTTPSTSVPKIAVFHEDIIHYESFRSLFYSVYDGSDIDSAERLMLFQSKFRGNLKIDHPRVYGENYAQAWVLLALVDLL